jgi:hypothetical protein
MMARAFLALEILRNKKNFWLDSAPFIPVVCPRIADAT